LDLLKGGEITGRRGVLWFYGLFACSRKWKDCGYLIRSVLRNSCCVMLLQRESDVIAKYRAA